MYLAFHCSIVQSRQHVFLTAKKWVRQKKFLNFQQSFKFSAAVSGHHYYKNIWSSLESKHRNSLYEEINPFDPFAIKTVKGNGFTIGHLPKEILPNF